MNTLSPTLTGMGWHSSRVSPASFVSSISSSRMISGSRRGAARAIAFGQDCAHEVVVVGACVAGGMLIRCVARDGRRRIKNNIIRECNLSLV